MRKWWKTKKAGWAKFIILLGIGGGMTYFPPQYGIPVCIILVVVGIVLLIQPYRYKDESKEKRQLKLDLSKLLLDGKEILVELEKMNALSDLSGVVSAQLNFEIWYKEISNTLRKTEFNQLWDKDKVRLDYYRKAKKADYIETCKHALDRLEHIMRLMLDKEDSQI